MNQKIASSDQFHDTKTPKEESLNSLPNITKHKKTLILFNEENGLAIYHYSTKNGHDRMCVD